MSSFVPILAFFVAGSANAEPTTNLDAKLSAQAQVSIAEAERALAKHQKKNPGQPFPTAGHPGAAKMIMGIEAFFGHCAAEALRAQPMQNGGFFGPNENTRHREQNGRWQLRQFARYGSS